MTDKTKTAKRPKGPVPLIYTLFPRLAGTMPQWLEHTKRARQIGFNWIHLNPIHLTGYSGSLYAIKDFYQVDPDFVPKGCQDPIQELKRTIAAMHDQGLLVMMDLVVNHTSKDCPLIKEKPSWFHWNGKGEVVSPHVVDPDDPEGITVWTDLADINNAKSPDRKNLWAYWTALVESYLDLGFDGFRCDAAYKVPAKLWKQLIKVARERKPNVLFTAETLGCSGDEMKAVASADFDYLFNSSKWWQFDKPWALEQHEQFGHMGPSIAFPETHDTVRVMEQSGGLLQVQKQRYAFAAAFSAGLLAPIGYEVCARRQLHVVYSSPDNWEEVADIGPFIKQVNELKRNVPILEIEGHWKVLTDLDGATTVLHKRAPKVSPLVLVINKDWQNPQQVKLPAMGTRFTGKPKAIRVCRDGAPAEDLHRNGKLSLDPAEVVYILADTH